MRRSERGFALLLVFALSASIAIFLYLQLPRAAFEAQRDKEQLLIERGEQYTRAIQLFVHKWKRYPSRMEELEETSGKRFLRRRYKDPMTGKDEWRLINIDGAGVLTNSLVTKASDQKKENLNTFITENPGIGVASTSAGSDGGQNLGLRRRGSEADPGSSQQGFDQSSGQQGATSQLGQTANAAAVTPVVPNAGPQGQFGSQGMTPEQIQQVQQGQLQPGQLQPGGQTAGPNGVPPQIAAAIMGGAPGNMQPLQPGQSPQTVGPQNPNALQPSDPNAPPNYPRTQPFPGQQGQFPGPVQFPTTPGAQPLPPGTASAGINAVNRLLTAPRAQQPAFPGAPPGFQLGGGIAGVASKSEVESIKLYNEREKYNEWEFIYDPKKDKRQAMAMKQAGQQQQNPFGNNQPGAPLSPGPPNQSPNPQNPQRPPGLGGVPTGPGFGQPPLGRR